MKSIIRFTGKSWGEKKTVSPKRFAEGQKDSLSFQGGCVFERISVNLKQWFTEKANRGALTSVFLLGLANPGVGWWPLAWVSLVPVLMAMTTCRSWKQAWRQGLLWGSLYHVVLFSWFWGMHPVTWLGFSSHASIVITITGWLISAVTQGLIISVIWMLFYRIFQKSSGALVLLGPVVWVMGLWYLNRNPIGLPWGFLAYSQADVAWVRQSAYALTFWGLEGLMVLINIALFQAIHQGRLRWLLSAGLASILILVAGARIHPSQSTLLQELQPVAIQGNVTLEAEHLVMGPIQTQRYYQFLIDQALAVTKTPTRVVMLPEGVIRMHRGETRNPYRLPSDVALLSGGIFRNGRGVYNGALLFSHGEMQTFAKRYLVPFGETIPFVPEDWFINLLKTMGIAYSKGFSKAPLEQKLLVLNDARVGPLICFEALYPNLTSYYQRHQANLLVTFSNLGWYHQHPWLEKQFLAINRMRAAESGMPLILVTNTGVSALISERGEVLTQADSAKTQFLTPTRVIDAVAP